MLSVIVPTLDEATVIAASLDALAPLRAQGHEVIVVDGGSRDATAAIARPRADAVIDAPRGRAAQMNAGAALARGDALVFLHADTRLPPDALGAIAAALARGARWGRFDVTLDGHSRLLPLVATAMNVRSRATGIATGDQAMFVARDAFAAAGGFAPLPLMEDIALSARLNAVAGPPATLRQRVVTSGRRWDAHGALRTIASMWRLRFDYWRGVAPARLAARYRSSPPSRAPTLIVFARAPVAGRVKTRLAASIGVDAALAAYRELAERTLAVAAGARAAGIVGEIQLWCDPDTSHPALDAWRERYGAALRTQRGADLGARMRNALADAVQDDGARIVVGTDCASLDVATLADAAAALLAHDAVLAPAEDGGYVLVGVRRDLDLFSDMPWSTPGLLRATRARLAALGTRAAELPMQWDIDTAADWARYRALSARTPQMPSPTPASARVAQR